jgi:prophage tail gpP-like protein
MNRYADELVTDNSGAADEDTNPYPSMFPIESIANPNRPTTGLAFARAGQSEAFNNRSDTPDDAREYVASETNKYKYWASPVRSQTTIVSGSYPIATTFPYVKYAATGGATYKSVKANKLVIGFEISQAKPVNWEIYLRTPASGADGDPISDAWDTTPISSDGVIDVNGQYILYYQSDGSWSSTPGDYLTAPGLDVSAIAVNVISLDKADHYCNVLEISPRLERDISDRVIDWSADYELGDDDQVSPVGVISSNTGSISVSNAKDGAVWPDNGYFESSPLYGPLEANVEFKIDFGIDTTENGGSGVEWTRLATMYSEEWQPNEDTMSIPLKDFSKYLQEVNPNQMLFTDLSVGEIIWRILDSVGVNNWNYNVAADTASMKVDYFWTNPEETVWRNIQDLCRGTQTVVYVDADGVIQIATRDSAFALPTNPADIVDLRSETVGVNIPNIEELSIGSEFTVNSVNINYRQTGLAEDTLKRPISEIVWQPEDTVILRCSNLQRKMLDTDNFFYMDNKDAAIWPFEGLVNIGGEIVRYSGKQYAYMKPDNTWAYAALYSADDKNALDNDPARSSVANNWRFYYTGKFYVKERGVGPTFSETHDPAIPGWYTNAKYGQYGGTQTNWTGGLKYFQQDGFLRLETNKTFMNSGLYTVQRSDPGYTGVDTVYGARFRFPTSPTGAWFNSAGIWFYGTVSGTMYMVEVTPTYSIEGGNLRAGSNEIRVLKRASGTLNQLNKGYAFGVVRGQWVDIDVRVENPIAGPQISVSVNGRLAVVVQDLSGSPIAPSNRCGIYTRGWTAADFEYFYAVPGGNVLDAIPDETDFLSQLRGGYQSQQLTKFVMGYSPNVQAGYHSSIQYAKVTKDAYRDRYIAEFGIPIHEVREYSVKFEKVPVLYSSLYVSNDDQIVTTQYVGNPFGADFTIANSSRINSVVNGEDTVTYGPDNSVEQKMVITARTIQQQDEKTYEVKDAKAIRVHGEIQLEVSSDWIQSEAAAKAIGDWIVNNWAEPADTVDVKVFGNPLIRVGDVVNITYAPKGISNVKFVVLSCSQSWDDGLETTITCRKCPQQV